jgi:protein ImuA
MGMGMGMGMDLGQAVFRAGASPRNGAAWVALIGPPHVPFGPALAACGLDVQQLLWVKAQAPAERLWATEQALRCAGVAAVLAWLPQAQAASLRRLQMAALAHAKLLFVMRPAAAQQESSPAVLRLLLGPNTSAALTRAGAMGQGAVAACSTRVDPDALHVQVLKRRGPPLAQALSLCVRAVGDWEPCHALDSLAA